MPVQINERVQSGLPSLSRHLSVSPILPPPTPYSSLSSCSAPLSHLCQSFLSLPTPSHHICLVSANAKLTHSFFSIISSLHPHHMHISINLPPIFFSIPKSSMSVHHTTSLAHLDLTLCPSSNPPTHTPTTPPFLHPSSFFYFLFPCLLNLYSSSSNEKTPRSPGLLSNSPMRRTGFVGGGGMM